MPSSAHPRVDLHFHVLPGVDDGPVTLEHSLRIARLAVRDGTRLAVATPHVRSDHLLSVDHLHERVRALQRELDRERIDLRLLPGAELGHEMVASLSDGALQTIAQGPPGRRWILLEAPFDGLSEDFHDAADELRTRGFSVLMAHPERVAGMAADDDRGLARELEHGTLLQVNSWSLAGAHGEQVRMLGAAFVALPEAAAIASDAHADWREPLLGLGVEGAVRAGLGRPLAVGLCSTAALALLDRGLQPSRSASGG
jgi:protein-tyrosine phosphatase